MTNNTKARIQYEKRVYLIEHTYVDEIEQANINYKNAIRQGQVEHNDKSRYRRNMAEIRSFQKRDKNRRRAYSQYLAAGGTGPELKAVYAYSLKVGRGQWTAQTECGKYFKTKILESNDHKVYISIDKFIRQAAPELYAFKAHAGYIILISDNDPLQDVLFADSPFEDIKK
jgi:hypothetical protein